MTVERVTVVETASSGIWVEAVQRSACASCNARSGCGQHTLSQLGRTMRLWVPTDRILHVGDEVLLELPAGGLAFSALTLYGLPLLLLIVGAALGAQNSEIMAIIGGLLGLGIGFIAAKKVAHQHQSSWQPRLLSDQAVECSLD